MRWRNPIAAQGSSTPVPTPDLSRPDLIAITLLLVLSLAIRLRFLSRPFHGDEMITFSNMVLGRDFSGILFGPFDSNSHLLNSLIMKAVYLGVGENPALMRLPNLIFVVLAIVILYIIGAREFGRISGFAAALLLSLHPALVLYSVSGRGYAGMVLFTLVSSALFLQLVRSFSWWRWFGCTLTGFLAGTAHLFAVNVLVSQILLALAIVAWPARSEGRSAAARARNMGPVLMGPVIALALVSALYLPQFRAGSTEGFHFPFQTAFPLAFINFMGGTNYRTDLDGISLAIFVLAVIGLVGLPMDRTLRTYLGLLGLAPFALYGLSFFAPVFTLHPRFFVYLVPFYCLLLVAGTANGTGDIRAGTRDRGRGRGVLRVASCLCVILIAVAFADRIRVPRGRGIVRAQVAVRGFVDNHPDARFLTNDTGFVRVRLRQEANMDRIQPALGIKPIRALQAREPAGEIYFIYIPRKPLTESDLIHFQSSVAPEVLVQRDDRLRTYLMRNAALELDLAPMVQIYALRSLDGAAPE
jgi:hypothetical protein